MVLALGEAHTHTPADAGLQRQLKQHLRVRRWDPSPPTPNTAEAHATYATSLLYQPLLQTDRLYVLIHVHILHLQYVGLFYTR